MDQAEIFTSVVAFNNTNINSTDEHWMGVVAGEQNAFVYDSFGYFPHLVSTDLTDVLLNKVKQVRWNTIHLLSNKEQQMCVEIM